MKTLITTILSFLCLWSSAQYVSTIFNSTNMQIDDAITQDKHGNIYGSHYMGSRIYKISTNGTVSVFRGGLNTPNGLAFDAYNNLYAVDNIGNRVYKFDSTGTQIFNVFVSNPSGIIRDLQSDSMIITQYTGHTIRKISSNGQINNIPMFFGNPLNGPVGLCYGKDSSLYIGNFTDRKIFKVQNDSLIYIATVGGPANSSLGFITFAGDFIFGTNFQGNNIYKVFPNYTDSTEIYAGSTQGNTDGNLSVAKFNSPNGIYASRGGDSLLISDFNTGNIRLISGVITKLQHHKKANNNLVIYPNPSSGVVNIKNDEQIIMLQVFDMMGKKVLELRPHNMSKINLNLEAGNYLLKATTSSNQMIRPIIINQ